MDKWLISFLQSNRQTAHWLAGIGAAIALTWSTSPDFRSYVEDTIHTAPHWVQALAGLLPFVGLIYANFRKAGD
jgi:hypothetical protein